MTNTRGGEGRKKVLTWLQAQKRQHELPEVLAKLEQLPAELVEAIRKKAGVPGDVSFRKMTPSQRYAMRNAAEGIFLSMQRKQVQAQKAFLLLVRACSTDERKG